MPWTCLLAEHHLPVLVAHRHELGVVVDVEELLARGLLLLAGEHRQLVVAVEVHLERLAHRVVAREQLVLDVRLAGRGQQRREPVERAKISLLTCPGRMRPGQRIIAGTR